MVSQTLLPWLVLGAAVVTTGAFIAANAVATRRRVRGYSAYALARGFTFSEERPAGALLAPTVAATFNRGHSRRWRFELRGSLGGREFAAAEYRFVTGGGKNSSTHVYAVMLWPAPGLPQFVCIPETFLQRVVERLGGTDFDFPEDPDFSKAYRLRGADEAAVRALFDAGRRALLVSRRDTCIGAGGGYLAWWRSGALPGADRLDEHLGTGDALARAFLSGTDGAG